MSQEFFAIRTRDGQYVGPLGFTPEIGKAVFFPSRLAALKKCADLGAVLDGAAIIPHSPAQALQGPASASEASGKGSDTPKRATTPWKAGNGEL